MELFTKYPTLKEQLQAVYASTLEPDRQEAQNKRDDDDFENGGNHSSRQRRQRRPNQHWAQDKADNRAVAQLIEMQLWNEGMAEFLDLVRMAHGNSARTQDLPTGC
jgi:hypothetical protein